jgi:hypothetical protein
MSGLLLQAPQEPSAIKLVWMKIQRATIPVCMTKYSQYNSFVNETYGDLLNRYLKYQVSIGCFPEALLTKLTLLRCNISICPPKQKNEVQDPSQDLGSL